MQKSSTDEDEILYVNDEHEKGVVDIPVPDGFRDLSLDHKPLGCLCSEIKVRVVRNFIQKKAHFLIFLQKPSEWQQYQLTQDQIDQFWHDGYLTNLPVLSSEQCDKLLKEYSVFLVSKQQQVQTPLLCSSRIPISLMTGMVCFTSFIVIRAEILTTCCCMLLDTGECRQHSTTSASYPP